MKIAPPAIFFRIVLTLKVALVLTACASNITPKVHAVHERGVNFNDYRTFNFYRSMDPRGEQYATLIGKYLRQSVKRELLNRGLQQTDEPDLLVSFYIHTKEKISSRSVPANTYSYYGYRRRYGYGYSTGYGTEVRISQYTEGTLNIDVVDRKRKQLVWEGVAIGRIRDRAYDDLEAKVAEVVGLIFKEFPR